MAVTWSDLAEETPSQVGPADAVTDHSTIDVVGFDRRDDGRWQSEDAFTHWYEPNR